MKQREGRLHHDDTKKKEKTIQKQRRKGGKTVTTLQFHDELTKGQQWFLTAKKQKGKICDQLGRSPLSEKTMFSKGGLSEMAVSVF
jgi:hypothetical protein